MIPDSVEEAGAVVSACDVSVLHSLDKAAFLRAWAAVAYLYPGLHPDGFEESDSGWPEDLRPFAAEAWRRASEGGMDDGELYPANATWARLFDERLTSGAADRSRRARIRELGLTA